MPTGIFNSGQFAANLKKLSFAQMITRLMPNGEAPLFGITGMMPTKTALQTTHGFYTKTMVFPAFNLDATIAAGDTTFTVTSTANLLPGQLHRLQATGEIVIINSVIDATTISVGRSVGDVAAAVVTVGVDNENAYQVGNAFEESSLRPQALNINPVPITNVTQIFRDTWALSGTAEAIEVIAGDTPTAENKQDCAMFHASAIEKAIIWGQKSEGTRNGQPFRTMDGLVSIIGNIAYYPPSYAAVNVFTAGATTSYTQLEAMVDPMFDQTTDPKIGNKRLLFVGGTARKVVNNIGRLNGTYQLMDGQTHWGLQFKTFTTSRGEFTMIEHPLFNSNADWKKMALGVDISTFSLAYLKGRKTQNKEFNTGGNQAQDNGIDAVGGTLTTETTIEVRNPPACAVIYGLTAAAAG